MQHRRGSMTALTVLLALAMALLAGCGEGSRAKWNTAKHDFLTMPGDLVRDANDWITSPENQILLIVAGSSSAPYVYDLF